jgi:hypothetical protein
LSQVGVISAQRWRDNWRSVTAGDAVQFELPRSSAERRASLAAACELAAGTPVVVSSSAPVAAARCRAFASAAGIELEREYLAFPTAAAPAYLVEDLPAPVRLFVTNVLVVPPRTRFSLAMGIGLAVLRRLKSWRLVRMLAPGRVVVGRRK